MAFDCITFGESMVRLAPPGHRRLEQARSLDVQVGGAELNTAVGLARLGRSTSWVSRLTDNPLGRLIANHAREAGAHAPPESSLEDIRFDQDMVNFSYRHKDQTHQATARWCIDASGRTSVVGRTLNLTKCDLGMPKKIAVFSHFKGVHRNEGEAMGHITIVRIPQGWFWLIPLDETKTSVGLVQMLKSFKSTGLTPQESFTQTAYRLSHRS